MFESLSWIIGSPALLIVCVLGFFGCSIIFRNSWSEPIESTRRLQRLDFWLGEKRLFHEEEKRFVLESAREPTPEDRRRAEFYDEKIREILAEAEQELREVKESQKDYQEDSRTLWHSYEKIIKGDENLERDFRQILGQKDPELLKKFNRLVQKYQGRV